eukprot:Nk52_evm35s147 gene=Nk52_evmTU35s147
MLEKPHFLHELLSKYEESKSEIYVAARALLRRLQTVLIKGIIYGIFLAFIVCTSVTIYSLFYYYYIPIATHVTPLHFNFPAVYSSPAHSVSVASTLAGSSNHDQHHLRGPFSAPDQVLSHASAEELARGYLPTPSVHRPRANVRLTEADSLLRSGVHYDISLTFDLPESPANRDLGVFMIEMTLYGRRGAKIDTRGRGSTSGEPLRQDGGSVEFTQPDVDNDDMAVIRKLVIPARQTSRRPAMLRYRSQLLQTLETLILSPFLLVLSPAGLWEEKQQLRVFMFNEMLDNEEDHITHAKVELSKPLLELYGAHVHVDAHFKGLRYFMYWWPMVTGFVISTGIGCNIAIIMLAIWVKIREAYGASSSSRYEDDIDAMDEYGYDYNEQVIEDLSGGNSAARQRMATLQGRRQVSNTYGGRAKVMKGRNIAEQGSSREGGIMDHENDNDNDSISTISVASTGASGSTVSSSLGNSSSTSEQRRRDSTSTSDGNGSRGTSADSRRSGSEKGDGSRAMLSSSEHDEDAGDGEVLYGDDEIYRGVVDDPRLANLDSSDLDNSNGSRRTLNDSMRRRNVH